MISSLKQIIDYSIGLNKPDRLTHYFDNIRLDSGKLVVLAFGKAAWLMGKQASLYYKERIDCGIIITKYNHSQGNIRKFEIFEAGHPIVDENSVSATKKLLKATENMSEHDDVIVLISGGGSALLESPSCTLDELKQLSETLIRSGKTIDEINAVRKQLSMVKGGRLAHHLSPAHIHNLVLSDVVSQNLSVIASGPTIDDSLSNIDTQIVGSCVQLSQACRQACEKLGYDSVIVNNRLQGDLSEAKELLLKYAKENQNATHSKAFIFSGEITLSVTHPAGLGGRAQHLALSCAEELSHMKDTVIFCVGSDGTDGPTDAAGGYCDCNTVSLATEKGIRIEEYLANNDSYHCLKQLNRLIITGPTNTNVNDLYVILIRR